MKINWPEKTPHQRGVEDGMAGKPGPPFPTPGSDWATRLYNRGWETGVDRRLKLEKEKRDGN